MLNFMGYFGEGSMMWGGYGAGLGFISHLVWLVAGILLIVWLWKNITK